MIFLVFLESYKETAFGMWFYGHKIFTMPLAILIFLIVAAAWGYIDKKYVRPKEMREINETNEMFMDLCDKVDKIYEKETEE